MTVDCRHEQGQRIYTVTRRAKVLGFIVVDSAIGGRSRGGLRLIEDVSEQEIRGAARAMTLKYGLLGLAQGGAKAGVRGPSEAPREQRRQRLLEFAHAAQPLLSERVYLPDADMGTSAADIRWMMQAIGWPVRRRDWRGGRSGHYTAMSCLACIDATARHLGTPLAQCRIAIEGFGSVGGALARLVRDRGARVVAVSTSRGAIHNPKGLDIERVAALTAEAGSGAVRLYDDARQLPRAALLELPVDILCPCARFHSINEDNAGRILARAICAGANDPLSPAAERSLLARGVLCLPDFVSNCGGVLGGTMEFAALKPALIGKLIAEHIAPLAESLLQHAEQDGVTPRDLAESMALARLERVRNAVADPAPLAKLFALGLEGYRRGWLPTPLVAALAPRYFRALLRGCAVS